MAAEPAPARREGAGGGRRAPSAAWALGLVLAYMAVVFPLQAISGIPYDDWFTSADHALRTGVIPLGLGSLLIIVFLVWARWDFLWRDPARLPVSVWMWVTLGVAVLTVTLRVVGTVWAEVPVRLLLMIAVVGVLVGFAEEMLFRGVLLRALRDQRRSEVAVALWTSLAFGLFHLPNTLLGTGVLGVSQVLTAGLSGIGFYFYRRCFGSILLPMVIHGLWDTSLFFSDSYGEGVAHDISSFLGGLVFFPIVIGVVFLIRRERGLTLTRHGLVQRPAPAA